MSATKLFLIDGHSLCYRSFFAIRELSNSKGQATNAVFGFATTLRKIVREYEPDYVAVCFDSKGKTHRQEKFAEYKIQRPAMPETLISQIPIIKEVVKAYNFAVYESSGFEADDIIASISDKFSKKGINITIVSEDKDLFQLAAENVDFFSVRKDAVLNEKQLKEKLGFDPQKMIDFIGLAGDKADNIPGVAGIGEVTARNLINEYGNLESILKNIDQIKKEKVKTKLSEQKEAALFSKELAILDTKVPLKYDLKIMKVQAPNNNRLHELFKDLEFKRLAAEYAGEPKKQEAVKLEELTSKKQFEAFVKQVQKNKEILFLVAAMDQDNLFSEQNIFVSLGKNKVGSIPLEYIKELKKVLEDKSILKVTHNLKDTFKFMADHNIELKGKMFDLMLAGFLVRPSRSSFQINELAWTYLEETLPDEQLSVNEANVMPVLYKVLLKKLKDQKLFELFEDIEIPLSYVLAKMETNGVKLDEALLKKLSKQCDQKIKKLTTQLYEMAGAEFNINSPKQLGHILFEKLGLPVIKKTKTGFSTDEGVLTQLAAMDEFPSLVLEYRQLSKLKSTYIDALPKLVDTETGRLHAEFNQIGAETGRLSSRNPNLQNIPIRTELGREIRKAIIPSKKDLMIIKADYSQIELRVLAHLSQDKTLMKAFKSDQDIHSYTASLIFDVDESEVDDDMRNTAKRVNFGIVYGMSAFGLAKDLGITQPEAQAFIDRYFARYPDVKVFMDDEIKKCEKDGYVLTLLKRRRYIPDINSRNNSVKQFAQRQAINTPVQGSAADLIKLAMINIQKELEKKKLNSKMIITVHDELVFEVPKAETKDVTTLIRKNMENTIKLSVPIKVDMKSGLNWLEMKEI